MNSELMIVNINKDKEGFYNDLVKLKTYRYFHSIFCLYRSHGEIFSKLPEIYPLDTRRILNVCKTFRRHPGRLLHSYCTFIYVLCPWNSSGSRIVVSQYQEIVKIIIKLTVNQNYNLNIFSSWLSVGNVKHFTPIKSSITKGKISFELKLIID